MEITIYGDTVYIKEQKWYRRMKHDDYVDEEKSTKKPFTLYDEHPKESLIGKLVVHMECLDKKTKKKVRLFTVFTNYLEFAKYEQNFLDSHKCFFETTIGEFPQKPHFDIDITDPQVDHEDVVSTLIISLDEVLRQIGVDLDFSTDILIFSSHGVQSLHSKNESSVSSGFAPHGAQKDSELKVKFSYHIIVNNYCCLNHKEAKEIYIRTLEKMKNPEYRQYVDLAVYSSLQQFRIAGSCKQGTNRIKTLKTSWRLKEESTKESENTSIEYKYVEQPENDFHRHVLELDASLLSVTSHCQYIPTIVSSESDSTTEKIKKSSNPEFVNIDIPTAKRAIEMLANMAGMSSNSSKFPFRFLGLNSSLILLKRVKPSMCSICSRTHFQENSFMLIVGEEQAIYYNCRRSPKNIFVGKLNPKPVIIENVDSTVVNSTNSNFENPKSKASHENSKSEISEFPKNVDLKEMDNLSKIVYRKNKEPKPKTSNKEVSQAQLDYLSRIYIKSQE